MDSSMITTRIAIITATIVVALATTPALSQDTRVLRYGNTSGWSYDNRGDDRDSPTNGFFPGNYASDPSHAWAGAAGPLEINPRRSPAPYPSRVIFGAAGDQASCSRRHRSYDPASGTFRGRDGVRHRC
jgi:hypothetical protein